MSQFVLPGNDNGTATTASLARPICGLMLLTLVLRVVVILVDGGRLDSDPDAYVRLARTLADGHGYATPNGLHPTAFRPVLYPLCLAALLVAGCSAQVAVVFWNLTAGALLVPAAVLLSSACGFGRRASLLAGSLVALDPLLLRYTTEPMTENICAALLTWALYVLLRYVRTRQTRSGVCSGILLGLTALCRPVVLLVCVLLFVVLSIQRWFTGTKSSTTGPAIQEIASDLMPFVVAALIVSPWIVRNAIQFQALIPATTHGGYTLLLGNNSEFYDRVVSGQQHVWDGESLGHWQHQMRQEMQSEGVDSGSERSSDRWMYRKAITEMLHRPGDAIRAVLLRWKRFWAVRPVGGDGSLSPWLIRAVALWYVAAGAGVMLSLLRLRSSPPIVLLWTAVAAFLAVHSFYWTNTRMRAPLVGVLAVLTVGGWLVVTRGTGSRQKTEPTP